MTSDEEVPLRQFLMGEPERERHYEKWLQELAKKVQEHMEQEDVASRWEAGHLLNEKLGGSTAHGYGGENIEGVAGCLGLPLPTLIIARWLHRLWKKPDLKAAVKVGLPYRLALSALRLDALGFKRDRLLWGSGAPIRKLRLKLVNNFPGPNASGEELSAWEKSLEDALTGCSDTTLRTTASSLAEKEGIIVEYLQRPAT